MLLLQGFINISGAHIQIWMSSSSHCGGSILVITSSFERFFHHPNIALGITAVTNSRKDRTQLHRVTAPRAGVPGSVNGMEAGLQGSDDLGGPRRMPSERARR